MAKKKKKGGSGPRTRPRPPRTPNPLTLWNGRKIKAHFSWDDGKVHLRFNAKPGILKLVRQSEPERIVVRFKGDQLPAYWSQVVLLPFGTSAHPGIVNPPIKPIEDLVEGDLERALIQVIDEMNRDATDVARLEGYIPIPTENDGPPVFGQVRMVYLRKVIQKKSNPRVLTDLVLIHFRSPEGGEEPNGGGSGPPQP